MFAAAVAVFLTTIPVSCGDTGRDGGAAECAEGFAEAYFNWDYAKAAAYADTASRKWLAYMASQVDSSDVAALGGMDGRASAEVSQVCLDSAGAEAHAEVRVWNFLRKREIGAAPEVCRDTAVGIKLLRIGRGGGWKVSIGAPL